MPANAGTATPILDLVDVSKTYGGVQALAGVSVRVHEGEVLAVVGENGAGKSTLVGVAAGRVIPDAGQVSVEGEPLLSHGPAEAMKAGIRLVPQELLICPDMSVLDNVLLGQRPTRFGVFLDRGAARREVSRRLERLGVGEIDLDTPVGDLSVVQRTFVQIARGLSPGARVMLIDEPTAPMADVEVVQFLAVLRALTREGLAIVYISHRLKEIFQLADRINVLRDGRLVAELSGADMTYPKVISAMVGGRSLKERGATTTPLERVRLSVENLDAKGIRNVSLQLRGGEILVVYGISGSGREVLGRAIVGAVPRKGLVEIDGRKARDLCRRQRDQGPRLHAPGASNAGPGSQCLRGRQYDDSGPAVLESLRLPHLRHATRCCGRLDQAARHSDAVERCLGLQSERRVAAEGPARSLVGGRSRSPRARRAHAWRRCRHEGGDLPTSRRARIPRRRRSSSSRPTSRRQRCWGGQRS